MPGIIMHVVMQLTQYNLLNLVSVCLARAICIAIGFARQQQVVKLHRMYAYV